MQKDDIHDYEITAPEVEELINDQPADTEIIDVREDYELKRGILPNAVHVPLSKFEDHVDRFKPGRKYVFYCEHGIRSLDVVYWLAAEKQIMAKSMRGGFSVWKGSVAEPDGRSG